MCCALCDAHEFSEEFVKHNRIVVEIAADSSRSSCLSREAVFLSVVCFISGVSKSHRSLMREANPGAMAKSL